MRSAEVKCDSICHGYVVKLRALDLESIDVLQRVLLITDGTLDGDPGSLAS